MRREFETALPPGHERICFGFAADGATQKKNLIDLLTRLGVPPEVYDWWYSSNDHEPSHLADFFNASTS